jgi:hypothetical protein
MDVAAKFSVETEISANHAMKSMIVALECVNHKDHLVTQIARRFVMMNAIHVTTTQMID